MSNTTTTSSDVKQLAEKIESLAEEVQNKLSNPSDRDALLAASNELVRNSLTFVFTLGEYFALNQVGSSKTVTGTAVSNPSNTSTRWHNVRDTRGRFARKV
jgi:hypothetical protein